MTAYAYLRVSTQDKNQTTDNQLLAIQQSGIHIDEYVAEEISGTVKAQERPKFAEMFKKLTKGDSVVVTMTDRFGRNAEDVLNTLNTFEKMGVKAFVLQFGALDLTSTMGKMIVTVFAAVAEMERANLVERTKMGMARTKAEGTLLGAPLKISPKHMQAMMIKRAAGASLDKLSGEYGYNRCTIDVNIKKWNGKLDEYTKEYNEREKQYALKRAA